MRIRPNLAAMGTVVFALGGCVGVQSALAPDGPEAERVALLFWAMTLGAALILAGLIFLVLAAMFGNQRWRATLATDKIIVFGGVMFPVVVLTALLGYELLVMGAKAVSSRDDGSLRIAVVGEQWWWRVRYTAPDGRRIESANEIRIPVGRPVTLELSASDVIHSLWIPKLAGKLDMIPGRTTYLRIVANTPGISRGQCAEYCGGAHALMSLFVVAMGENEFDSWLIAESAPARTSDASEVMAGARVFQQSGCAACHAVRGTGATGQIGPDLTHVGSRISLGAATLPNDADAMARWIRDNQHLKPENKMPPYRIFLESELTSLAAYLASLK
jgi:cytochrome c oxidase subunit II